MRSPAQRFSAPVLRARGYSLVELLAVLAILGTLASLALPLAEVTVQRQREQELRRALWEIRDAIDAYRAAKESGAIAGTGDLTPLPRDLQALTQAYPDLRPGRTGATVRFLRRVPRDPFADPALPADQTWGLRSYQSEPTRPMSGDDVYDVYSRSSTVGLNEIPVSQW